jgi:ABC-2 type transport system permease protein
MRDFIQRVFQLLIKELFMLLSDKKMRFILVGPPFIQLMIFSYAATFELNHLSIAMTNHDRGDMAKDLVEKLAGSSWIDRIYYEYDLKEIQALMDEQKILAAITIPEDFSHQIDQDGQIFISCIVDGRRANSAQMFVKYFQNILDNMTNPSHPIITSRYWFNENLQALWTTVPAMVIIISMLMGLLITGLSISREREMGTLDALLVSPIQDYEIILAKAIPGLMIGVIQSLCMACAGVGILKIPFTGSPMALFLLTLCYVFSIVGLGISISSFAKNQQQSIIGVFLCMVPCVTLSGYAAPVENMPFWMQFLSAINPLTYGLLGSKAIFLKGGTVIQLIPIFCILLVMGSVSLSASVWLFRKRRAYF